jgi:hypothetical protein
MAFTWGCGVTVDQAIQVLEGVRSKPADAVYRDGRRLRLGSARLVRTVESDDARIEWRGVKVKRSGTITAIVVGGDTIAITPRDVRSGMTFSASAPVEDIAGRGDRTPPLDSRDRRKPD